MAEAVLFDRPLNCRLHSTQDDQPWLGAGIHSRGPTTLRWNVEMV